MDVSPLEDAAPKTVCAHVIPLAPACVAGAQTHYESTMLRTVWTRFLWSEKLVETSQVRVCFRLFRLTLDATSLLKAPSYAFKVWYCGLHWQASFDGRLIIGHVRLVADARAAPLSLRHCRSDHGCLFSMCRLRDVRKQMKHPGPAILDLTCQTVVEEPRLSNLSNGVTCIIVRPSYPVQ